MVAGAGNGEIGNVSYCESAVGLDWLYESHSLEARMASAPWTSSAWLLWYSGTEKQNVRRE